LHLVLFFTHGVSLRNWVQNGSLEREMALYMGLQAKGVKVSFVTYGGRQERDYQETLHGVKILCNRWNLPPHWYERLIPILHADALRLASVIKTNQTNGANVALRAAQFWHKPLIARCGYMWSEFADLEGRQEEAKQARQVEKGVFTNAKRVVVTTPVMKEYAIKHYALTPEHVEVIPNYVLTEIFFPGPAKLQANRICFIGRLNQQKNLPALFQACVGLDVELLVIGEGPLRTSLQELAKQRGVKVSMPGNLPHHQLPEMIRQSAIFALVSTQEGHPKSLLEAMSCGAAVLGADSPGIREQIVHGETGWLCGTDPQNIRAGIQHLLGDPQLRQRLGANARRFIVENYSLEKIVEMEYNLLNEIVHWCPANGVHMSGN
jgi:glycosyltransferase involved in cell wall biosynthesis